MNVLYEMMLNGIVRVASLLRLKPIHKKSSSLIHSEAVCRLMVHDQSVSSFLSVSISINMCNIYICISIIFENGISYVGNAIPGGISGVTTRSIDFK